MYELLLPMLAIACLVILPWICLSGLKVRLHRTEADRRAEAALWDILSQSEREQLGRCGHLDLRSPGVPGRIYRIPRGPGLVSVYDAGRLVMKVCLRPVEQLPDPDVIVIHKLMIEGCEPEYLKQANVVVGSDCVT